MTPREYQGWIEFWKSCPFDDEARFYRPAALLVNSMNGADIAGNMKWLKREVVPSNFSDVDLSLMARFGVKPTKGND